MIDLMPPWNSDYRRRGGGMNDNDPSERLIDQNERNEYS